ncbi:MAG: aminodeoxychorismate synthase component I [Actinomycetota bacterium]|nr:aminodeoxychorismate synthase component I [Actinomycetota bacterium]
MSRAARRAMPGAAGAGWRCRFDHAAGRRAESWELVGPLRELVANSADEVPEVLALAENEAGRGRFVAGFLAYEAAPGLDSSLEVRTTGDGGGARLPLAWFGVFGERRPVPSLASLPPAPSEPAASIASNWQPEITRAEHAAGVATIREAIAAGDVYLVNLTTRLRRRWQDAEDGDPFELYRRLVAAHAGGFHAYLDTPEWVVACGSPELFVELAGGMVTTRPMKGTVPRGRWVAEDLARAEALQRDPKERAENVMVVDLLRNDLGRIAVPGGVEVSRLWRVERYPTVWQLTSTVRADLPGSAGLVDVFRAAFPSGSVTGTPKVSAMREIKGLEVSPRGVYCGAVGWVAPGRSAGTPVEARFAVAIRTAVIDRRRHVAEYGTGGGITFDSIAEREWEEVLVKARGLGTPGRPSTDTGTGWGLIETMRADPPVSDGANGVIHNLRRHLDRLASSAFHLGFPPPAGVEARLAEVVTGLEGTARVRLVWWLDGWLDVTAAPIESEEPDTCVWLCVDPEPVRSSELTLYHKTTRRDRYDSRAARHTDADDVVLVNERGEATETTRANLLFRIGSRWYTPPVECGLLPGVERGRLLDTGQVSERSVNIAGLSCADELATVSSLRGRRPALLVAACRCPPPSG